jgi:hypothetical protein
MHRKWLLEKNQLEVVTWSKLIHHGLHTASDDVLVPSQTVSAHVVGTTTVTRGGKSSDDPLRTKRTFPSRGLGTFSVPLYLPGRSSASHYRGRDHEYGLGERVHDLPDEETGTHRRPSADSIPSYSSSHIPLHEDLTISHVVDLEEQAICLAASSSDSVESSAGRMLVLVGPTPDTLTDPTPDTFVGPVPDTFVGPFPDTLTHSIPDTFVGPVPDTLTQPTSDTLTHPIPVDPTLVVNTSIDEVGVDRDVDFIEDN